MTLLDDIADFLAAQSTSFTVLGGTAGNLAKSIALDNTANPATLDVVYETGGLANSYTYSTTTGTANVASETPGFQILSRSTAYQTARSRAETAYQLLDGLAGRGLPTATGTHYEQIVAVQAPFFLQRDANERFIVACNYLATKQRTSS